MSKRALLLAATSLAMVGHTAHAQVDEIIVTATKRAESVQDVSLSVAVVGGEALEKASIKSLEEVSAMIPNVHISEAQAADNIFIRGIGSGVNQGFEQSVGTFIDGVYYGRGRSVRNPFFDVARIEVLKGPQSTLFGKNTIAGAFNITSNRPTFETEGRVTAAYEVENDGKTIEGVFSTPLSDTFAIRLAGRYYETDGYLENSFTGTTHPDREEYLLRASALWEPTDKLDILVKGEISNTKVTGRPSQLTRTSPLVQLVQTRNDPAAEFDFDYRGSNGGVGPVFSAQDDDSDAYNFTINANYDIGEHTLTSVTGFNGYEYMESNDSDAMNVGFITQDRQSEYSSFGQEIRLTSPTGGKFDYIIGAHYSKEDLEFFKPTHLDATSIPEIFNALTVGLGVPGPVLTVTRIQDFQQDTESLAVFADGTFNVSDQFRINGGLRWTQDKKDADKNLFYTQLNTVTPFPLADIVLPNLGLGSPHTFAGLSRKEDAVTGSIAAEFDMSSDILLYGRYARGFKAGGFDEDNAQGSLPDQEFQREEVDSFEVGFKSTILDGMGRLNVSAFHNKFSDLQVSTFDGVASFVVGNAASAITKGLEAELTLQPTDKFDLAVAVGLLDAKYDEFVNGPSIFGGPASTDLSGRNLQFAPDVTFNFNAGYDVPLNDDLALRFDVNGYNNSGYDVPGDLDPFLAQGSFFKLGGQIRLSSEDGGWDLAVIGKNLTNEKTTAWGNDVPLGNLLGNNYFQFIDPPRTVTLQATKRF